MNREVSLPPLLPRHHRGAETLYFLLLLFNSRTAAAHPVQLPILMAATDLLSRKGRRTLGGVIDLPHPIVFGRAEAPHPAPYVTASGSLIIAAVLGAAVIIFLIIAYRRRRLRPAAPLRSSGHMTGSTRSTTSAAAAAGQQLQARIPAILDLPPSPTSPSGPGHSKLAKLMSRFARISVKAATASTPGSPGHPAAPEEQHHEFVRKSSSLATTPSYDARSGGGGLLAGGGELMSSREGTPGTTPRKRHAQRRGAIPRPWGDALEMCVVHSIQ